MGIHLSLQLAKLNFLHQQSRTVIFIDQPFNLRCHAVEASINFAEFIFSPADNLRIQMAALHFGKCGGQSFEGVVDHAHNHLNKEQNQQGRNQQNHLHTSTLDS